MLRTFQMTLVLVKGGFCVYAIITKHSHANTHIYCTLGVNCVFMVKVFKICHMIFLNEVVLSDIMQDA